MCYNSNEVVSYLKTHIYIYSTSVIHILLYLAAHYRSQYSLTLHTWLTGKLFKHTINRQKMYVATAAL